MLQQKLHGYLSFGTLLRFLLILSLGIQLIIITFNHFTAYHTLSGPEDFLQRIFFGTLLSFIASLFIAFPDLLLIRYLNRHAPWGKKTVKRIIVELILVVLLGVVVSIGLTMLSNAIGRYRDDLSRVLLNNAVIFVVVNILLAVILEGWSFFAESRHAKAVAKNLREEISRIKFEILKNQINPHFMFNSLNVLSGLIGVDDKKAQEFIDEFSQIYRYVLETIEQPVSTLGRELGFIRSYLFLQKIRYGDCLSWTVNVPGELLPLLVPPLSLQTLLENAIKHNIINPDKPLNIEIFAEAKTLVVKNNIQPKISAPVSTGVGLKNLTKRYALISKQEPAFFVDAGHYIAKLPLINTEADESTDN